MADKFVQDEAEEQAFTEILATYTLAESDVAAIYEPALDELYPQTCEIVADPERFVRFVMWCAEQHRDADSGIQERRRARLRKAFAALAEWSGNMVQHLDDHKDEDDAADPVGYESRDAIAFGQSLATALFYVYEQSVIYLAPWIAGIAYNAAPCMGCGRPGCDGHCVE